MLSTGDAAWLPTKWLEVDQMKNRFPSIVGLLGALAVLGLNGSAAAADDLPQVRVDNVRRVFWNGEHNAFTDLIRWRDRYYLTFRSCPDGHMQHASAKVIVLASGDTKSWDKVVQFSVPKRDTRDPHFLDFQGKLFVYTGTWYCGDAATQRTEYDVNEHLGFGVWTDDGVRWSQPEQLEGTYGHYIWRAAAFDGKAYLCARRRHGFAEGSNEGGRIEAAMLESEDGLRWRFTGLFHDKKGDETAFLFEPDGQVVAVVRSTPASLCRSRPPYQAWQRKELDRYIGGPLLARWGGRYLVGGRKTLGGPPRTALYWLTGDGKLRQFAELPSGGDNSYPGFVQRSPNKGLVSWYSSHEKDPQGKTITAIYLADLVIE
jgi:hypothetical protein